MRWTSACLVVLVTLLAAGVAQAQEPPVVEPIAAQVNVAPATLNLKSKGNFINVQVLLPEGMDPALIDGDSVTLLLGATELLPVRWAVEEGALMLKFSRSEAQSAVTPGVQTATLEGLMQDATPLSGSDTIRVISHGKKPKKNQ